MTTTAAPPVMLLIQPVEVLVALTVNVPAVACTPKSSEEPVPVNDAIKAAPLYIWYNTPGSEPLRPTDNPVLPEQKLPPPVTLNAVGNE